MAGRAGGELRWYLVRHGATVGDSENRFHGRGDVALSLQGKAQVEALAPFFLGVRPVVLVHSPLSRARDSALYLARAAGWTQVPLVEKEGLRELDFGRCEGMTRGEIEEAFPEFAALWRTGKGYDSFPGGESLRAFTERVAGAVRELEEEYPRGDLVMVAHKGVLRRVLWALVGREDPGVRSFNPPLGSLTVIRKEEEGWILESAPRIG